jgi:hypothetical protein
MQVPNAGIKHCICKAQCSYCLHPHAMLWRGIHSNQLQPLSTKLDPRTLISPFKRTYKKKHTIQLWDPITLNKPQIRTIPTNKMHLHINFIHATVTTQIPDTIRQMATTTNINIYYAQKYNWITTILDNILWNSHGDALTASTIRKYKAVSQFIHKWLPINASYSKQSIGTVRLCP